MTINSTIRKAGPFIGNGTASSFPFTYKVFQASDLDVVRLDESTNIETTLALTTDYTVVLNQDQDSNPGGTVTLVAGPLATGYTLTMTSDVPNLQPTDLTNQGGFYPEVINDALDRATIQIQQLQEQTDRTLRLPLSSTVDAELPNPSPNDLIGWDATGNALTNVDPGSLATVVAYATAYCDVFVGNGITTSWTLTRNPAVLYNLDVSINGSTQEPTRDYTLSGTTFTMTTPPPIGARVVVKYKEGLPNYEGDSQDVRFLPAGTGAVQRTVQAKLRELVSVTDFGASETATASQNVIAIQKAIDYAIQNNCWVIGSAGDFPVNGQIIIDTRTADPGVFKFVGNGMKLSVPGGDIAALNTTTFTENFNTQSTGGLIRVLTPDSDSHLCVIEGVHFAKPDSSYPTRYGTFINISTQRNINVSDCVFDGGYDVAILVTAAYGVSIERNSITGFNTAIWLYGGANGINITNNSIRNGRSGLLAQSYSPSDTNVNLRVYMNIFESLTNRAITFNAVGRSIVMANYFEAIDQSSSPKVAIYLSGGIGSNVEASARNLFIGNYGWTSSSLSVLIDNGFNNCFVNNVGITINDVQATPTSFGIDTSSTFTIATLKAMIASDGIAIDGFIKQQNPVSATLQNSWADTNTSYYGPARYWRDPFGNVHLEGNISGGSLLSAAFTLPVGYRPEFEMTVPSDSNGAFGQIRISTNGQVIPRLGSTSSINLNGIVFRAYGY